MRKLKKMVPILVGLCIIIIHPYIDTHDRCSHNEPVLHFGNILGCAGTPHDHHHTDTHEPKVPSAFPTGGSNVDVSPNHRNTSKITFIELGSDNCVPCRMMRPIMEAVEKKYHGWVTVLYHDVLTEKGKPFAAAYGVRSIPAQVFLDGQEKVLYFHTGFLSLEEIEKILRKEGVNQ